jgi:uncharacterized membrane protein
MDELVIARAIHIVGVVLWIGGVAFVTTVLLPGVRRGAAVPSSLVHCKGNGGA